MYPIPLPKSTEGQEFWAEREAAWNEARDNLFHAKVVQTHYYNLQHRSDKFLEVGDKVLLKVAVQEEGVGKKLSERFRGPFVVKECRRDTIHQIMFWNYLKVISPILFFTSADQKNILRGGGLSFVGEGVRG